MYAVLFVVAILAGGNTPDSDASAQHAVSSFVSNRTQDRVTVFLIAYATIFAMFFAAALRSYLKARSKGDGLIALGFSGMIIFVIGALTLVGMEFAATDVPAKISPAAEQALNVLQDDVFFALLVGAGIFLIGNGLAIVASARAAEVARLDRGRRSRSSRSRRSAGSSRSSRCRSGP